MKEDTEINFRAWVLAFVGAGVYVLAKKYYPGYQDAVAFAFVLQAIYAIDLKLSYKSKKGYWK